MSTDEQPSLTGSDSKIDPSLFPVPKTQTYVLEMRAAKLRSGGAKMRESGDDIVQAWGGLSECYQAPEAETLYVALDEVSTNGSDVESATDRVAGALETFAETVLGIKSEWRSLKAEANTFLAEIADDDDWNKPNHWFTTSSEHGDENARLIEEATRLIAAFEEAERDCAEKINAGIAGRTNFLSGEESQGRALGANDFVYDTVNLNTDIPSSWGEPPGTDKFWYQDVGDAVWDFGVGAVEGVGAMVGAHSSEGWLAQSWGDSLKEYHWDNLTSAASLVGMYDAESDSLSWSGLGSAGEAWKDLAHSVVPWEEWGDRPGYVIGTALLNIGATVGGAVLTATGVGAVVGVPLMAWRGAAILDGMGGSGRGGSDGGSGVDLPDLPTNTPINAQVGPGQMEVIKAYMDQLVNPVYADSGDLGGGSSGSGAEGSGAGRVSASNSQQQGDHSAAPASHRRSGEQPEATTEELRVFDEIMENDPQLKDRLEKHEPAFREHDPSSGDPGDGSWTGGSGVGRPLADGPSGESHRPVEGGSDPRQDQRVDLSGTNESGLSPRSDGDSTHATASEHSRGPVAVLEREGSDSGGDGSSGRDGQNGFNRITEDEQGRTTSDGGALAGGGLSSGGPGGPDHGTDSGLGSNGGGDQNGGTNTGGSRDGGHQGNRWDKEWNNDKLDKRYRAPVVPEERVHPLKPGDSGPPKFPEAGKRFAENQNLEPNSAWQVEGRGVFYTGSDGQISHIDTHPGNKVDGNPELKKPRKNTNYAVDVIEHPGKKYHYETDEKTRTTHAHGQLQRLKSDAEQGGMSLEDKNEFYRTNDQRIAGKMGGKQYVKNDPHFHTAEWDGGHFFGTGFGGSGHHLNLYAQIREVNQNRVGSNDSNSFFKIEQGWRELLADNKNVEVTFDAKYSGDEKVPNKVIIKVSVDGGPVKRSIFENAPDVRVEGRPKRKYWERFPSGAGSALVGSALLGAGLTEEVGPTEVEYPDSVDLRPQE